jgi:AbrB family looped-hinge helix DNA binding protein
MRTTIDANGRVVVPKHMRDALGLAGGAEVEVSLVDGHVEVAPAPTPVELELRDGVWVAVAKGDMPVLTTEMVRDTLEQIRR